MYTRSQYITCEVILSIFTLKYKIVLKPLRDANDILLYCRI